MTVLAQVLAEVRDFDQGVGFKTQLMMSLTQNEALRVAQLEPTELERARAGVKFSVGLVGTSGSTPTGRAPQTAVPTTAATWLLWNGYDSSNPKSLYLEWLTLLLFSGTASVGGTLLWTLSKGAIAAPGPTAATGYAIKNNNNASSMNSKAVFTDNQTLAADPGFWAPAIPAGGGVMTAAATIGQSIGYDVRGGIVVPPGYAVGFAYLSGAGTSPLYLMLPSWSEFIATNR